MRRAHFEPGTYIEYPKPTVLAIDAGNVIFAAGGRVFSSALDTDEYLWWTEHSTFLRGRCVAQSTVAGTLWREHAKDWRDLIGVSTVDGRDLWRCEIPPGNIYIHPSTDKFIVETDDALSAIDANSGRLEWTMAYESWDQSPVVDGNALFAISFEGFSWEDEVSTLTAIDISTGTPRWSKAFKRGGLVTVHSGRNGVLVVNAEVRPGGEISSYQSGLDFESGTVIWERPFPGQLEVTTCVSFGDICVTSYASDDGPTQPFEVTSIATGEVLARWEDDTVLTPLMRHEDVVFARRYRHDEPEPPQNTLVALDLETSQVVWEVELRDQYLNAKNMAILEGSLLIATPTGLQCMDLVSGQLLGEIKLELGPRFDHGLHIANEQIVVSNGKDRLHFLPTPSFTT